MNFCLIYTLFVVFIFLDVVLLQLRHFDALDRQHFGDADVDGEVGNDLARIDVDGLLVHSQTPDQQLVVRQIERHFGLRFDIQRHGKLVGVADARYLRRRLSLADSRVVLLLCRFFLFDRSRIGSAVDFPRRATKLSWTTDQREMKCREPT